MAGAPSTSFHCRSIHVFKNLNTVTVGICQSAWHDVENDTFGWTAMGSFDTCHLPPQRGSDDEEEAAQASVGIGECG